jgi:hypothetical protein
MDVASDDRQLHPASLERANESCVVRDAPRQPVEAVHNDAVDSTRSDPIEQPHERRSLERRATLANVVEALLERDPPLRRVGSNQIDAGIALRIA